MRPRSTALTLTCSVTLALIAATLAGAPSATGAAPDPSGTWSAASEVSTPSTRDASQLVISANRAGDVAAAWESDGDIAAVLKSGSGAVSAPQVFAGGYDDPDIAIGGDGVGVLAWESGDDETTVYASAKAPGAGSFSDPATFHGDGHSGPTAPASAQDPSVAVNANGTGMLFFERDYYNPPSYTSIAEAIEGRVLLNPGANTWNSGLDLAGAVPDPRGTEVSVAADGSAALAMNTFEQGPYWGNQLAVLEENGSGGGGDRTAYSGASGIYNGIYPSNTRMPNGDILMAFGHHSDEGTYALDVTKARATGAGGTMSDSEVRLDNPDGSETGGPALVRADAAGNAIVVWWDDSTAGSTSRGLRARYRAAGQTSWGPVETVPGSAAGLGEFDFAVDGAGNGYLVFNRGLGTSGAYEVAAVTRSAGAAGGWFGVTSLSGAQQGDPAAPRVAAGDEGHAFAAWIAGAEDRVYFSSTKPAPPKPPVVKDTKPPVLKLRALLKKSGKNRVVAAVSCNERCTVVLRRHQKALMVNRPKGVPKRAALSMTAPRTQVLAGHTRQMVLKFKGKKTKTWVRKTLNRKKGRIVLRIRGQAVDRAGNRRVKVIKVNLR